MNARNLSRSSLKFKSKKLQIKGKVSILSNSISEKCNDYTKISKPMIKTSCSLESYNYFQTLLVSYKPFSALEDKP